MVYHKSQSGSAVTFSIVAIVFVGLIIGTVWYAHQRGASDASVPQIAKNKDKQASEPVNEDKQVEKSSEDKQKAESEAKKKIESEKSDKKKTASKDKITRSSEDEVATEDTTQTSHTEDNTHESTPMQRSSDSLTGSAELPETGPSGDLLASIVGLVAILGSGYVYYHFGRK